jgi:Flp pilus assembly protein TadD
MSKSTKSTAATAATKASSAKTDFHSEVTASQQFNVHVELARALESQGNFEAAIAEYQKAADVCSKKGSILRGSGVGPVQQALAQRRMAAAYDRMGRFAQSETHYTEALKLAPGDAKVWNDVGYSYYLQNRWADAERALKTADSMDPNNPRTLTNLGLVLAAESKNQDALTALSRANGPAVGHANLGFILAAMGKDDQARAHYESALAIRPELTAAREALARIGAKKNPAAVALTSQTSAPSGKRVATAAEKRAGSRARNAATGDSHVSPVSTTGVSSSAAPLTPTWATPAR